MEYIDLVWLYWKASRPYYGDAWGALYLDVLSKSTFVA